MTFAISLCLLEKAHTDGIGGWHLWLLGFFLTLCTSYLSIALVNWLFTIIIKPNPLPRMDYSKGIPDESRTLVVVPTMLVSTKNIEEIAEALEVRFLANRDKNLHFGLLTDFTDAIQEVNDEDTQLVEVISQENFRSEQKISRRQ